MPGQGRNGPRQCQGLAADNEPMRGVQVFLNGEKLPVKAFQDYVELYLPDKTAPRIYERFSDRWEVCITPSDGQFHQARPS